MPADKNPIILNGRFLSVNQTGVQRVARQLLLALAEILREQPDYFGGRRVMLAVPPGVHDPLIPAPIELVTAGRLKGQFWEQVSLPRFAGRGLLVSLCNLSSLLSPGVLMIHDAQIYLSPGSYSWAFRNFYRFAQPLMAKRARRVLTVSNYSRDMLILYRVAPAAKITVIQNGVDHILKVPADPTALARLELRAGGYVLAMASLQLHKNIAVLLRAFAEPGLAGAKLVLAGAANAADVAALGVPCPENVRFAGKVSDAALRALMEGAACLAFPSTTEGFGMPPMEAMILGCPAVVSPRGAMPEICGDAATYVEPDDVQGWAAAMARFIDAPQLRQEAGQCASTHAAPFTWARSARQLAEILKQLK